MRLFSLLRRGITLLLPGCCALCGADGPGPLCAVCSLRLTDPDATAVATMAQRSLPLLTARCRCCAIRLPSAAGGQRCAACMRNPPSFDLTLALADYLPPLDRLLLDLKFHACLPLATALGTLLARTAVAHGVCKLVDPHDTDQPSTVLLPVPLSRERLTERGFNQAHEIARPLAKALRLPITTDACARIRHTQAQTMLPVDERRVNMRSAFAVLQRQAIAGKAILAVDDVMTTGHTLEAFAACLKRNGATHVTNLVIARTPAR